MIDIRSMILDAIKNSHTSLQSGSILREVEKRIRQANPTISIEMEEAILTQWHALFQTGYLAWGVNLCNPDPPHFHVMERGRVLLENLSRDPGNPDGYLKHLQQISKLNDISQSYIGESIQCYVAGLYKASAVMVGVAAEAIALELSHIVIKRFEKKSRQPPKGFTSWKIKEILKALKSYFEQEKNQFETKLREEYEAYWEAFSQQIRFVRNDGGHPVNINPISENSVHAALLIFPELVMLTEKLKEWLLTEAEIINE